MKDITHIIFDWDGTLMDSTQKIVNCMQIAASKSQLGIPTAQEVKAIIGISLIPAIEKLFGVSRERAQKTSEYYKEAFVELDTTPCELFAQAHEVLSELAQHYTLGVATGKARRGLKRAFAATDTEKYFNATRCADDPNVISKPDPKMLIQLLTQWQIAPNQALMVGDTTHDLKMAHAINMPSVGVSFGAHAPESFAPYSPIAVIDSLPQLLPHLGNNPV